MPSTLLPNHTPLALPGERGGRAGQDGPHPLSRLFLCTHGPSDTSPGPFPTRRAQVREEDELGSKPKRRGKVMSDYEKWEIAQLIKSGAPLPRPAGLAAGRSIAPCPLACPRRQDVCPCPVPTASTLPLTSSGVPDPGECPCLACILLGLTCPPCSPPAGVLDPSEYPGFDEEEGGVLAGVEAEVRRPGQRCRGGGGAGAGACGCSAPRLVRVRAGGTPGRHAHCRALCPRPAGSAQAEEGF